MYLKFSPHQFHKKNLNFQISKLILEGPENELQLTKNTQPAILTVSYSIFKVLKEEFNFNLSSFNFFAGLSLGEYSALVCADSIKFKDALYLLFERGKSMQEAVPLGKGKMIAILGSNILEIQKLIKNYHLLNLDKELLFKKSKLSIKREERVRSKREMLKEKWLKQIYVWLYL